MAWTCSMPFQSSSLSFIGFYLEKNGNIYLSLCLQADGTQQQKQSNRIEEKEKDDRHQTSQQQPPFISSAGCWAHRTLNYH